MYASTGCPGPYIKARAQQICNDVNAQLKVQPEPSGYLVSLEEGASIYDTPGGKEVSKITKSTRYTIVKDKKIGYITYGQLKSGAGWVVIKNETPVVHTPTPTPVSTSWWSGKYDPQIRELQQILNAGGAGLICDGIAGDKTFTACKKYTVKMGDKGNLVRWVQKRLGVSADGIAGNQTMNAIYAFQRKNGLGVGYLGGNDWKYLIR